jgi:hypothetical protein
MNEVISKIQECSAFNMGHIVVYLKDKRTIDGILAHQHSGSGNDYIELVTRSDRQTIKIADIDSVKCMVIEK